MRRDRKPNEALEILTGENVLIMQRFCITIFIPKGQLIHFAKALFYRRSKSHKTFNGTESQNLNTCDLD